MRKSLFIVAFSICLVFLFCAAGCRRNEVVYLMHDEDREQETKKTGTSVAEAAEADTEQDRAGTERLTVFVCGAVNKPGVYLLPAGSRANAAVEAAGGFRQDADTEWCNLAQVVNDGQKLRIYSISETKVLQSEGFAEDDADYSSLTAQAVPGINVAGGLTDSASSPDSGLRSGIGMDGRINLNSASKEQLMTLPGIGETRAEAILSWRRQHGSFSDISQIKEISGIGDAIFNQIRDYITV